MDETEIVKCDWCDRVGKKVYLTEELDERSIISIPDLGEPYDNNFYCREHYREFVGE